MKNASILRAAAVVLVQACTFANAADDQGVNDYAKAHWSIANSCVPFVRKYQSVCGNDFSADTDAQAYDIRATGERCSAVTQNQHPAIQKGDVITVHLSQVFINEFVERGASLLGFKKRGEIAIVARIAEQDAQTDFDFSVAGRDRGRLIYYSEGVAPGQYLNFSQLPIYGPIEYHGKPLLLEFYIMELDIKENTEISGLLTAAASLGAVAYPPASPVLKVLDTIGGGLLKANKSDIEFKYHASLLPGAEQINSLHSGRLEYGNYAFVRMPFADSGGSGSSSTHPWTRWWFNQKNGRIYEDATCNSVLKNRTYLTVQINRAKEEATLDPANTFAAFTAKLSSEAQASTAERVAVIDALKASVNKNQRYRDAKKLIDFAQSVKWPDGTKSEKKALDAVTVSALAAVATKIETSSTQLRDPQQRDKADFDESQIQVLVDALSRLSGKRYSPQTFKASDLKLELEKT
ncbi:hypothetical protein FFI97_003800 [Variovorax sp. KBS0712]|uniref:hypothetical protein n=1 Tax=Variovorax sp. KBS0712 TaxID=2578111 RepID=UPI0011184A2C|nr:hypothetical protein [Variovorax sp. KBS0712]TSD59468.1 hypothetical protein FFI97_003800 [Variovorax sp. KBS0712]